MDYFVKRTEKYSVEPEEILLDPSSADELNDSKFELPIEGKNFIILFVFIIFILMVFGVRAGWMQIVNTQKYSAIAKKNMTRNYPILAPRGIIYDRSGVSLVENIPSFEVVAIPADLPRNKNDRDAMIMRLADALGVSESLLAEEFANINLAQIDPLFIQENVPRSIALFLETKLDSFPGIEIKKAAVRHYIDGKYFSHILGYTGKVSVDDLRNIPNLSSIDYVGKAGVEASYDAYIRGVNGNIEREVDAISHLRKEKKMSDETSGANITLSIDGQLQKKLTDVLGEKLQNTPTALGATAVAMNPKTGEVLAMVSLPSYDSNMFSVDSSNGTYQNIKDSPHLPFFNRALSGQYPPGSSIKPFIASASLEEGLITKKTSVLSTGAISIQNQYDPNIVYTYRDWQAGGHGVTNVIKAIADSVNTFFYAIGGGYGDIKGLGIDRIKSYLELYGFGKETGIDIAGENTGLVPNASWKKETLYEQWSLGDTYNTSIGQGNLLVTPIQLAQGYVALANGGTLLQPYVVQKISDINQNIILENKPHVIRENFIDKKNLDIVREGMRATVLEGTAKSLRDLPVAVAAKTGTAQIGQGRTHAWFSSFAPYDNPSIAMVILVESGGEGSVVALPVAKEVYQWYFTRK